MSHSSGTSFVQFSASNLATGVWKIKDNLCQTELLLSILIIFNNVPHTKNCLKRGQFPVSQELDVEDTLRKSFPESGGNFCETKNQVRWGFMRGRYEKKLRVSRSIQITDNFYHRISNRTINKQIKKETNELFEKKISLRTSTPCTKDVNGCYTCLR